MSVSSATRDMCGDYKIKLENEYGQCEADAKVTVLDVPRMPEGPITFDSITKDGLKMYWKAPLDDGGSEIIGYTVDKCRHRQQTWKPVTASAKHPQHEVQYLKEGVQYNFRVCALNLYGSSEPLMSDRPVLIRDQFDPPMAPRGISAESFDLGCIDVTWKAPESDGGSPITGYVVEKKERGSAKWTRCNRHPLKDFKYELIDLIPENLYQVRVLAINAAGESEPCTLEKALTAQPALGTVKAPKNVAVNEVTDSSVSLTWDRPLTSERMKVIGYMIEKKPKDSKEWTPVTKMPRSPVSTWKLHSISFASSSFLGRWRCHIIIK